MESTQIREASHAGSWYTENAQTLNQELDQYLGKAKVEVNNIGRIKAVIGPHAGFYYSGPTAAWAYQYLQPQKDLRVFLLGPCHHTYMPGCGLSKLKEYSTPLGNITLDKATINEVSSKGGFQWTNQQEEEDEHSLEMHLPYIYKMLNQQPFKLVPIMVGNTNFEQEKALGKLLAPYFDDENTIFCISSDFCHWGSRFQYTVQNPADGEIWQSIEKLDRQGMTLIQDHDAKKFQEYLESTKNTICGRHPIGVLLQIINQSKHKEQLKTQFVKYDQSSKVTKQKDSSVSYASSITYIPK